MMARFVGGPMDGARIACDTFPDWWRHANEDFDRQPVEDRPAAVFTPCPVDLYRHEGNGRFRHIPGEQLS